MKHREIDPGFISRLHKNIVLAINEVGMRSFKSTSLFASNEGWDSPIRKANG